MAYFAGRKRGWFDDFKPEASGLNRDIGFFLGSFTLALTVAFLPSDWHTIRLFTALLLLVIYFLYLMATIRASKRLVSDGHGTEADNDLYVAKFFTASSLTASLQLLLALIGLIVGARLFVGGVESMSEMFGVAALVVALLIVPVATELPEKVNSILWIRRRRDTLAFGNITGAMVFQGSMIPAVGMLIMPWHITSHFAVVAALLALVGVAWLFFLMKTGRLKPAWLIINAGFYAVFIALVVAGS